MDERLEQLRTELVNIAELVKKTRQMEQLTLGYRDLGLKAQSMRRKPKTTAP